jgi:pimeloyl-ACP methyl ester carboxylesterase
MNTSTTGTLAVPGARLYHEVRGRGPALLLIPGGNGDTGPYERAAAELAARFTVVTYDRRGYSRSPLDRPPDGGERLAVDVDDALGLLDRFADGPAVVFGSSSGAIVALDLVSRRPESVGVLVAHEPPAVTVLPDADDLLMILDDVYATYRSDGVGPAMQKFNASVGLDNPFALRRAAHPGHLAEMMTRMAGNLEFWLEHELRQYPRFPPDIEALRAVSTRLVLAGGRESRQFFPYRPNTVLAERLHLRVVDFPGGHVGYATHPTEFATQLVEVLADTERGQ